MVSVEKHCTISKAGEKGISLILFFDRVRLFLEMQGFFDIFFPQVRFYEIDGLYIKNYSIGSPCSPFLPSRHIFAYLSQKGEDTLTICTHTLYIIIRLFKKKLFIRTFTVLFAKYQAQFRMELFSYLFYILYSPIQAGQTNGQTLTFLKWIMCWQISRWVYRLLYNG